LKLTRSRIICAAAVLGVFLSALAWYGFKVRPARLDLAETARLAAELAPALRAETTGPEGRIRIQARLDGRAARGPTASALLRGALAFMEDDPAGAARFFSLAAAACPDDPHLPSFQAAANLRLGNHALALDLYRLALDRKTRAGAEALDLAGDEMGATLALFLLGRPAEARQYVEKAWQTRLDALGPDDPETLAAANRLATTYVSLDLPAEDLLRDTYLRALLIPEDLGAEALSESRLLLTVLYHQAGRQAELEEFFDQALVFARKSVQADAASPPSSSPAPPVAEDAVPSPAMDTAPPPASADQADWEGLAQSLAGRNEALAADLWARLAANLDSRPEDQRRVRRELARAALGAGQTERALAELGSFPPADWFDAAERASLGSEALARLGRWPEAVSGLTRTAESLDAFLETAGRAPDPALANLSLSLRLKLADIYLRQGRVPQEAEIELRSALGRHRKMAALCPLAPEINLRLARLTRTLGRSADSREFYKRARAGAESLLATGPGPAVRAALTEVARAAEEESRPGKPAKTAKAAGPAPLPEPELLRLEMTALAALGRLSEFNDRLKPVLEEAAGRFGPGGREYLLYYSLWLKWLEESGRVEELTRALTSQAAEPPGRSEVEKRLNRGGALFYAARVNEKAGRQAEAVELYQAARAAWQDLDRPEGAPRLADRLAEVEAALSRLRD
jgi:tetratricopeptide (TPR) repeat protein